MFVLQLYRVFLVDFIQIVGLGVTADAVISTNLNIVHEVVNLVIFAERGFHVTDRLGAHPLVSRGLALHFVRL